MYRFPVILLLAVAIVTLQSCSVHGSSQHMICKTVESVFGDEGSGQPAVAPRVLQGRAGKRGIKGERGFPGLVNNQTLEHVVEEKLAEATKVLLSRIDVLENKVEELLNSSTTQTLHGDIASECGDGVAYNGKCYFAIIHGTRDTTHAQGEGICNGAGGTIVGIWSKQHQTLIENYVREKLQNSDLLDQNFIWLSMTYDDSTKVLRMPNGNSFPSATFRWYPSSPWSGRGYTAYTAVWIRVNEDQSFSYQGLENYPPSTTAHGVLCAK